MMLKWFVKGMNLGNALVNVAEKNTYRSAW